LSAYIPGDDDIIDPDEPPRYSSTPIRPNEGLSKEQIKQMLREIGEYYKYHVEDEIHTGFSKVDTVWFDNRIAPIWFKKRKHLENSLAIPIIGFEIEEKSAGRKYIRGDIDSLNSLSPSVGVIVFSDRVKNVTLYRESWKYSKSKHGDWDEEQIKKDAIKRTQNAWLTSINIFLKFTAASPKCRIVIWEEKDLIELHKNIKDNADGHNK